MAKLSGTKAFNYKRLSQEVIDDPWFITFFDEKDRQLFVYPFDNKTEAMRAYSSVTEGLNSLNLFKQDLLDKAAWVELSNSSGPILSDAVAQ